MKEVRICFNFNEREAESLQTAAEDCNLPLSLYVFRKLLPEEELYKDAERIIRHI